MDMKSVLRKLSRAFLTGLATVLPITVTLGILLWLFAKIESFFGGALEWVLGGWYVQGMGVAFGVLLILVIGLSLKAWAVRKIYDYLDHIVARIPVISTVYGTARDLMDFFSEAKERQMGQVVMVTVGQPSVRLIGFVTRESFDDCPEGLGGEGEVAVYLPMSYQMGGYTVTVPHSCVEPLDMSFQDAMRYALTAGMAAAEKAGPTVAHAIEEKLEESEREEDPEEEETESEKGSPLAATERQDTDGKDEEIRRGP